MTLRERRKAAGLRQIDVAAALEVDQSAVSHWEHGMWPPLEKYRVKLAKLYRCTVEELEPKRYEEGGDANAEKKQAHHGAELGA